MWLSLLKFQVVNNEQDQPDARLRWRLGDQQNTVRSPLSVSTSGMLSRLGIADFTGSPPALFYDLEP